VPYTLFVVYVFAASFPYRKYLASAYRTAYFFIGMAIILASLIIIIYDPVERYRYSVYQLGFTLLILNLKGYQEYHSPEVYDHSPAASDCGMYKGLGAVINKSQ
jgi:hypothetical protein